MQVYGQLQNACLESLSANPTAGTQGRVYWNSTTTQFMLDDGTNQRALLRNDQKMVLGTNGTAASNIRLNRAAAATLQLVTGDDTTAEGSLSTSLAKLSFKYETYTNAGKPAAGAAGRVIYVSDLTQLQLDTGAAWAALSANVYTPATRTTLTSTGTQAGYWFQVSGITIAPTAGATYTNNGVTYTVLGITNGNTYLWTSNTGGATVLSGSTLTKTAGTGDASITFTGNGALAAYTPPGSTVLLKVTMVGGGGGGGSSTACSASQSSASGGGGGGGTAIKWISNPSGTYYYMVGVFGQGGSGGGAGNAGSVSAFGSGSNFYYANGGTGGGAMGTSTTVNFSTPGQGGSGSADLVVSGSSGGAGITSTNINIVLAGAGGGTLFGGLRSPSQVTSNVASQAGLNYGGGGVGGAGVASSSAQSGGNGAPGLVLIEEFYQ